MICLLDASLFVLDVTAWTQDRSRCQLPMDAMLLPIEWLPRWQVKLVWADDFFNGFPWNQPAFPTKLTDFCNALMQFYSRMQSNDLLWTYAGEQPTTLPIILPDLLASDHLADMRETWLQLLGALIREQTTVTEGLRVSTWTRPETKGQAALTIQNAPDLRAATDTVAILQTETDWQAFIQQYHRPDLSGKRIAVLGGERATFERAKQRLSDQYHAAECRHLPPHYQQNRSEQQTAQRLQQMDILIICTNRLKHSDTEQIKNLERAERVPCPIIRLNNDTTNEIVQAVVDHFRQAVS